ncbi:MAG: thioesterase family protein [Parvularculaceae bacterium]
MSADFSKPWPVAGPFIVRRVAGAVDIDGFGHVNNGRYVDWVNEIAWRHSQALGFSIDDYQRIGCGCVVWRHEFDYVSPILEGDAVDVATWIADNDGRVRLTRAYEMRHAGDGRTLFRGTTKFVTIDMTSGRPMRMPKEFVSAYAPTV